MRSFDWADQTPYRRRLRLRRREKPQLRGFAVASGFGCPPESLGFQGDGKRKIARTAQRQIMRIDIIIITLTATIKTKGLLNSMRFSGRIILLLLLIPAMAACRTNPLPLVNPGVSESSTPSLLLPSESATGLPSQPDLVISLMYLEMEGRHGNCVEAYMPYGIRVIVENLGSASAGPFFVNMNGTLQEVKDGLKAGQHVELHFAGTIPSGSYAATARFNRSDRRKPGGQQYVDLYALPPQLHPRSAHLRLPQLHRYPCGPHAA